MSFGWHRLANAATGVEAYALNTSMGSGSYPYVFGSGATDSGRMSTTTRAGGAITVPDTYGFGEMWEIRFTFAESGNSQRQGIFLEVRTNAANSSTIRGAEIDAAQEGAIAVGTLEGANIAATLRSTSTGNVTNAYGVTGEFKHNSAAYTGTVASAAAVRGKFSFEDGATYTYAAVFLAEAEAVSGGGTFDAVYGTKAFTAGLNAASGIDLRQANLQTINTNQVRLMAFTDAAGTDKMLVYDPDNATVVAVANYA